MYSDLAEQDIADLEKKLTPDLDRDMNKFKYEISELLKSELISRYYFQTGSIKSSVKDDECVLKAIEILKNKEEYKKILAVKD